MKQHHPRSVAKVAAALAYLVALRGRIRDWRDNGRKLTRRRLSQWHTHRAAQDTQAVLQVAIEDIGGLKLIKRGGKAEEWEQSLLVELIEQFRAASRRRGRPKRRRGLIESVMERGRTPKKPGRPPVISPEELAKWSRRVFAVKKGAFARKDGEQESLSRFDSKIAERWYSNAEIDLGVPTAKAVKWLAELLTESTGTPPDSRVIRYVRRYYRHPSS